MHLQSSTLCRYYATGSCRRASACRFVHLQPESVPQGMMSLCLLRLPRTYIAEIPPSENAYSNEQPVHTRICRYYAAGHCRRGSTCHFVHSLPESAPQGMVSPSVRFVSHRLTCKEFQRNTAISVCLPQQTRGAHENTTQGVGSRHRP